MSPDAAAILAVLRPSRENARKKEDLARLADWYTVKEGKLEPDTRRVEHAIHDARAEHAPICSGSPGYWLTDDPDELAANAGALGDRIVSIRETIDAMKATAEAMRLRKAPPEVYVAVETPELWTR